MISLHQGRCSVMDYAIAFQALVADPGWNDSVLIDAFLHGLAAKVKDQLISLDNLEGVIALTNKIDRSIQERGVNSS